MKVKKLVELLLKQNQNSEVMLWNGYVSDVTPIDPNILDAYMIKPNLEVIEKGFEYDLMRDKNAMLTDEEKQICKQKALKVKREYTLPCQAYVTEEHHIEKRKKKIIILSPKEVGKETFDRMGKISY